MDSAGLSVSGAFDPPSDRSGQRSGHLANDLKHRRLTPDLAGTRSPALPLAVERASSRSGIRYRLPRPTASGYGGKQ